MDEILDVIHKTIYQFFDVCDDDEEVPMTDKNKLLLEVNKAICNNLKALPQKPKKEHNKEEILECIKYLQQRVSFANHIGEEYVDYIETNKINLAIEGLEELLKIKY